MSPPQYSWCWNGRTYHPDEQQRLVRDRDQCRMLRAVLGQLVPAGSGTAGRSVRDGTDQLELWIGSDVPKYWCNLGATTSRFLTDGNQNYRFRRTFHKIRHRCGPNVPSLLTYFLPLSSFFFSCFFSLFLSFSFFLDVSSFHSSTPSLSFDRVPLGSLVRRLPNLFHPPNA